MQEAEKEEVERKRQKGKMKNALQKVARTVVRNASQPKPSNTGP